MSKENVFSFLTDVAKDEQLKAKVDVASGQEQVMDVARQAGYDFSSEHVDEVLGDLKQKPGFWNMLAEAALEIFSPDHDDYPATGVQPFSGDPNRSS